MTTYYIRTFELAYDGNWNTDVRTTEGLLHSYPDSTNTPVSVERLIEEGTEKYYHLYNSSKAVAPIKDIVFYNEEVPTITWNDKNLSGTLGFASGVWGDGTHGWTNPDVDLDTFKQELCQYFEDSKNEAYGLDNGNNNLYLFKYRYNDYPSSGWAYYPVFMKGSDPQKDETKVAS